MGLHYYVDLLLENPIGFIGLIILIIFLVIGFGSIIKDIIKEPKEIKDERQEKYSKNKSIINTNLYTFKDIEFKGGIDEDFFNNSLKFLGINKLGLNYGLGHYKMKLIPWNNVISCNVKTIEQLEKDISLGKVFAIGILALASKKKLKINTLVEIVIKEDEEKFPIYLESKEDTKEIVKQINKMKE